MQDHGIAGPARASVSGLGVCDVWRLELSAIQWPWLRDELDEVRGPLEEELRQAWAKETVDDTEAAAARVAALEHELRLVRQMRAELPASDHGDGVVFVGPAELVRELVSGTLRNVVDALSDRVTAQRLGDQAARRRLVDTARAASEWSRTFVDCHELEVFSFDAADPRLRQYAD